MPMPSSKAFSTPPASSEGRLLDASLLAALDGLSLPVRRVRGALHGVHPGSGPGPGEDFFQHRPYADGEDVRAVDWRASARLGHLVVKERHRPMRQPLVLLLDGSASMAFPRGGPSKGHRARQLGAALALLALRRGDPVTLQALGPKGFTPLGVAQPVGRAGAAAEALLARAGSGGRAELASALAALAPDAFSGKHAVLLSDLYGQVEGLLGALERLARAGAALTVLHLLSGCDTSLPEGARAVRDAETGETRAVEPPEAQAFRVRVEAWQQTLKAGVTHTGAEWVAVDADAPPGVALRAWLGGRR
jgi:uncharacterized protein (DUF58 family)